MSGNKKSKAEYLNFNPKKLAQILSEQQHILSPLKKYLQAQQNKSHECFRLYLNTSELIHHRAKIIDELLIQLWHHFDLDAHSLCLIAVGGYGRGELHPYSDIDLLILCKDTQALEQASAGLQSFITLLWDLNLDIGHSVRTLDECQAQAAKDLSTITNLLESRPLSGNTELYNRLKERIETSKIWPADAFFHAKWDEIKARHEKYKRDEYNLEPDIKHTAGTLRDIQTITWVTARLFGKGSLEALKERGFLTLDEYEKIHQAREFLWTLRYCLHMLAEREEDRLLFDWRKQMVEILNIQGDGNQLAVEKLMRSFYRTQLLVTEICDLLLLHFNQDFLKSENRTTYVQVHPSFVLANDYLQLTDPDLFSREPHWLLEVFLLMGKTPNAKGIHSLTIRALRENRHLIDESFRNNPKHNELFMQIIRNPHNVVRELSRMMRYGILARYIPEFGKIIGWMDHDLLNVYTLEVHTFKMIKLLRQFRINHDSTRERFSLASKLINQIQKKETLYLAALLHKTGKSQKGNEIDKATNIAQDFCTRHRLNSKDSELIVWLIKNQNRLQQSLQHLDVNNPDDIHQLAVELASQSRLDALYLFTVANIEATNPKLWTSFRADKMQELHKNVSQALLRGLKTPFDSNEQIEKIQTQALENLQQLGQKKAAITALWENLAKEYFLREGVENVVWQSQKILQHKHNSKPLVAIKEQTNQDFEGGTEILVYMPDRLGLFAAITATLDQLNLNIQDARIMGLEDKTYALDIYTVLDERNQPIQDKQRLKEIQQKLEQALTKPSSYSTIIRRKTARTLKHFNIKTQISLSNLADKQQTRLDIIAADRPGLLAKIGSILSAHNIQIVAAKILTEGERVNDSFFITDKNGCPLSDKHQCESLKQALIEGLNEQIKAQSQV